MNTYTVALLGATGAVGREMLHQLELRNFPVGRLIPLASHASLGKTVTFRGRELPVVEAAPEAFRGADLVLGAAEAEISRRLAPAIAAAGAVYIDNSSAFRLDPQVPLVVPEVNGHMVREHHGVIANPNCCTTIALTAISGLLSLGQLQSITVSTYQAVSGAGVAGMEELHRQLKALALGEDFQPKAFPYPIAMNLIPQIGETEQEGYTSEEMKLQNEGRRILGLPDLPVSCTCVRVPVLRSHALSLSLHFDRPITVEAARAAIAASPGVQLLDDTDAGVYPMPLYAADQDAVLVGRVRRDLTDPKGLCLWCCGDQIRKGAATNAVQIAELLIRE